MENRRREKEEIYETSRTLNIYFITFTKQSCLSELSDPAPIRHVSILCFRDLGASMSVPSSNHLAAFGVVVAGGFRVYCKLELNLGFRSLI